MSKLKIKISTMPRKLTKSSHTTQ